MSDAVSRLLIVDDDPELLRFLLDELSGAGHQCSGCDNGRRGGMCMDPGGCVQTLLDLGS